MTSPPKQDIGRQTASFGLNEQNDHLTNRQSIAAHQEDSLESGAIEEAINYANAPVG